MFFFFSSSVVVKGCLHRYITVAERLIRGVGTLLTLIDLLSYLVLPTQVKIQRGQARGARVALIRVWAVLTSYSFNEIPVVWACHLFFVTVSQEIAQPD